ncbi:MAG TPA: hypothetical protein VN884_04485 [Candidatus Sulfotelmatobacter sp.]|nr:hypothetical protein [Candidatus Sulfotelmatobacter sp.]
MKKVLSQIVDQLEQLGAHVAALEGTLIANSYFKKGQMDVSKEAVLHDVRQKLSSLRSAIDSLPED